MSGPFRFTRTSSTSGCSRVTSDLCEGSSTIRIATPRALGSDQRVDHRSVGQDECCEIDGFSCAADQPDVDPLQVLGRRVMNFHLAG